MTLLLTIIQLIILVVLFIGKRQKYKCCPTASPHPKSPLHESPVKPSKNGLLKKKSIYITVFAEWAYLPWMYQCRLRWNLSKTLGHWGWLGSLFVSQWGHRLPLPAYYNVGTSKVMAFKARSCGWREILLDGSQCHTWTKDKGGSLSAEMPGTQMFLINFTKGDTDAPKAM